MKLNELAVANPTKQAAKVFESYFGDRINFENLSRVQARNLLKRVRSTIAEHRRTPEFHHSEQNSAYLKLVVMEQALSARVMEQDPAASAVSTGQPDPAKQAALMATQIAQKKRQIQDQIRMKQKEIQDLQKQMNNPTLAMSETRMSLRQRLKESEVQQAQVVLASQDMVDEVQKMSEQVSAMQFKDLPALVDSIKNQVGVDQATQFNGDASAALSGLLQNLQGAKQQLEAALGVVTGQAAVIPGEPTDDVDMGLPAEPPIDDVGLDVDTEIDTEVEPGTSDLGRERR